MRRFAQNCNERRPTGSFLPYSVAAMNGN